MFCYSAVATLSRTPSFDWHTYVCASVIGCVFFFMWCSFSIRCVFHYQIFEQWTNHPKFTWYSCLGCLLSYVPPTIHFIYLFISAESSSWQVCAYCLSVPFLSVYSTSVSDCEQCNDGIMIIAAKIAKDLKCDNFGMCCVYGAVSVFVRTNLRVCVAGLVWILPMLPMHWLLFGDNSNCYLSRLWITYVHAHTLN